MVVRREPYTSKGYLKYALLGHRYKPDNEKSEKGIEGVRCQFQNCQVISRELIIKRNLFFYILNVCFFEDFSGFGGIDYYSS